MAHTGNKEATNEGGGHESLRFYRAPYNLVNLQNTLYFWGKRKNLQRPGSSMRCISRLQDRTALPVDSEDGRINKTGVPLDVVHPPHQNTTLLLLPSSQDHTEVLTPAYNGYGNEDDLYAMGLSLEPLTKEVNQEEYDR